MEDGVSRHPFLVAREPGVPSRFYGPARSEIRYSTKPHFHSNWPEVGVPVPGGRSRRVGLSGFAVLSDRDAGWKPALRGVFAVTDGGVVVFCCALAQQVPARGRRSKPGGLCRRLWFRGVSGVTVGSDEPSAALSGRGCRLKPAFQAASAVLPGPRSVAQPSRIFTATGPRGFCHRLLWASSNRTPAHPPPRGSRAPGGPLSPARCAGFPPREAGCRAPAASGHGRNGPGPRHSGRLPLPVG